MKRSDMIVIIEDVVLQMLEDKRFYKPYDPYDPDKEYADVATIMSGPIGNDILTALEEAGMLPPCHLCETEEHEFPPQEDSCDYTWEEE